MFFIKNDVNFLEIHFNQFNDKSLIGPSFAIKVKIKTFRENQVSWEIESKKE